MDDPTWTDLPADEAAPAHGREAPTDEGESGVGGPSSGAATTAPRLRVGSLVGRTLDTYGSDLPLFLALALPGAALGALLAAIVPSLSQLVIVTISTLVSLFAMVAMAHGTEALRTGRRPELADVTRRGLGHVLPVALSSLAVVVPMAALFAVAAVLLVLSGTGPVGALALVVVLVAASILAVRWALVLPAIVLDRHGPIGALNRSWTVSRGNAWRLVGLFTAVGLLGLPAAIGVALASTYDPRGWLGVTGALVGTVITTALFPIPLVLAYADLTGRTAASPVGAATANRRPIVLGLLLGLGTVVSVAGIVTAVAAGGRPFVADRGRVLAGTSGNPFDPCHPGGVRARFSSSDEIWVSAVLSRHVDPAEQILVRYLIDGVEVVSEPLEAPAGGLDCYYEFEPLVGIPPATYRLEVRHDGDVVAEGEFVDE